MLRYLIVNILGKQVKVQPNVALEVPFLGDIKEFKTDKILVKASDKLEIGNPYIKKHEVKFEVLGSLRDKIRVSTYKAKANTRRTRGQKITSSKIRLVES